MPSLILVSAVLVLSCGQIVIFLSVDACVGLNWLLVSFLSHVNKNIIHSFIHKITESHSTHTHIHRG